MKTKFIAPVLATSLLAASCGSDEFVEKGLEGLGQIAEDVGDAITDQPTTTQAVVDNTFNDRRADSPDSPTSCFSIENVSHSHLAGQVVMALIDPNSLDEASVILPEHKVPNFAFVGNIPDPLTYNEANMSASDAVLSFIDDLETGTNSVGPVSHFIDEEGGSVQRARNVTGFSTLPSAAEQSRWADKAGLQALLGQHFDQLRDGLGVAGLLGPVLDIDNGSGFIGQQNRSYGASAQEALDGLIPYMNAANEAGVLTIAKHFPDHGNAADTHAGFAVGKTMQEIRNEVMPLYKAFIDNGQLDGIMTAHVTLPDAANPDIPASLYDFTYDLIDEMGFDGLVMTDALNMEAILDYIEQQGVSGRDNQQAAAAVIALKAGADMVLVSMEAVDETIAAILDAFPEGSDAFFELQEKARESLEIKLQGTDRQLCGN